jgi:hypothetical protein
MRILNLENNKKARVIEIKAVLGETEFEQLAGDLDNLCLFSTKRVVEPSTAIKTGARHSYAKYLLFPVSLRRQYKTDDFDFEKLVCGVVKYRDKLFVLFGVPRKNVVISIKDDKASEVKEF